MLFNSLAFLVFLPLFMGLYFATRGSVRLWISLIASYVFYGWWDWRFLFLIAFSTVMDYLLGILLADTSLEQPRKRRSLIILSVVLNLTLLGVFKYFNFFVGSAVDMLHSLGVSANPYTLNVILPVGISFYTFQSLSYTVDVYRDKIPAERSLLRFAIFVAFFPHMMAGPIIRAAHFLPQLQSDRSPRWGDVLSGINLVAWGYVLKVGLADSLAPIVEERFGNPEAHTALSLTLGVLAYAFQIYGDFAGYSFIAIGLGRVLGYDFGRNFDRPYFSQSFSEFWQRWHISLSTWLRDYLYISLGGNRLGPSRTQINLMLTMLLGGLWHGANWTFVFWGFLHGLYLVLQRVLGPPYQYVVRQARLPGFVSRIFLTLLVFSLTCLAWVFFRATSFEEAWIILSRIATEGNFRPGAVSNLTVVLKGMFLVFCLVIVEALSFRIDFAALGRRKPWLNLLYLLVCGWIIVLFGTFRGNTFIYFQF